VARFGRLDSSSSSSSGIHSYACSLVHSELSWGLRCSLHSHVAVLEYPLLSILQNTNWRFVVITL
jgi:hypothetical protein